MYDYFKLSRVTKKRIYPTFISTIDGMLLTKIKIFFYNPEFIEQVTVYWFLKLKSWGFFFKFCIAVRKYCACGYVEKMKWGEMIELEIWRKMTFLSFKINVSLRQIRYISCVQSCTSSVVMDKKNFMV